MCRGAIRIDPQGLPIFLLGRYEVPFIKRFEVSQGNMRFGQAGLDQQGLQGGGLVE